MPRAICQGVRDAMWQAHRRDAPRQRGHRPALRDPPPHRPEPAPPGTPQRRRHAAHRLPLPPGRLAAARRRPRLPPGPGPPPRPPRMGLRAHPRRPRRTLPRSRAALLPDHPALARPGRSGQRPARPAARPSTAAPPPSIRLGRPTPPTRSAWPTAASPVASVVSTSVAGPSWAAEFSPRVFNGVPPAEVRSALREMFGLYGLPGGMRLDNGPPWGASGNDLPRPWRCGWRAWAWG